MKVSSPNSAVNADACERAFVQLRRGSPRHVINDTSPLAGAGYL